MTPGLKIGPSMGNLGRMTQARVKRAMDNPNKGELWHKDYVITIVYDDNGAPIQAEQRCKNKQCCNPKHGTIAVHVWDLGTLEYETKVLPDPRTEQRAP